MYHTFRTERGAAHVKRVCRHIAFGMLVLSCAAAEAKTCFKAPREIGAPSDGLIYRSTLDGAAVDAPATIDFRTTERYMVEVNRSPVGGAANRSLKSAPIGLRIFLKDPLNRKFEVYCEVKRLDLDTPFRDTKFFVYSPLGRAKEWRLQLTDHGNPLKEEYGRQDPLSVRIVEFPAASASVDAYGKRGHSAGPLNVTCESFFARLDKFKPVGPVLQEAIVGVSLSSKVFYARTLGPVQVEFHTDVAKLPSLPAQSEGMPPRLRSLPGITVAVKDDGVGPFAVGCDLTVGLGGAKLEAAQFNLTRAVESPTPALWRIEVVAPSDMNYDTRVVLRYPGDLVAGAPFPTELQCAAPSSSRRVIRLSNNKQYAGATVLQVALADPEGLLTVMARDEIAKHVLLGMALWRPICYLCTPDQLVLARVDGKTYVLQSLLEALDRHYGRIAAGAPPLGFGPVRGKYEELVSSLGVRYEARGFDSNSGYVELRGQSLGIEKFCKDDLNGMPLTLQRVRRALACDIDRRRPDIPAVRASAQLAFKTTPLDGCPEGINTIACESSALKIEFNAKDYKFVSHYGSVPIAGNGKREADLLHVLAHEIGHWIGIGHLEQRGSLMSEAMGDSRCIDTAAAHALNVLSAGGDFPVTKPQAFVWEPPDSRRPRGVTHRTR